MTRRYKSKNRWMSNVKWKLKGLYYRDKYLFLIGIWIFILLIPFAYIERLSFVNSISWIFYAISIVSGFYLSYRCCMWIDRRLHNHDFHIWLRRIIAGIMTLGGFAMAVLWSFAAALTIITTTSRYSVVYGALALSLLSALIVAFFLGIAFLGAYMEFTFERRAGILIFSGRQRF